MANKRLDPVSYRQLRVQPLLSEGLLSVSREGGDLERKVAAGFARLADDAGRRADLEAEAAGKKAGMRDAMTGAPTPAKVSGGNFSDASGGGAGIRVSPKASNERAAYARDYLQNKHGFSPVAAAAVAGHGMQESGFNLDAVGDQGTAFGAFQWRNERKANLQRFAATRGQDWKNLDTQLDFAVHELSTSEQTAGKALASATSLDDAVAAFMHFERPQGYSLANPRAGHGYSNRLAYAQSLIGNHSEGEGARLPSPASVAPVSVTPVREPVTIEPGKPGTFRPTGRNTVYGRAYDVAGTRTYLETVDAAMVQNQQAIYDAYKDDPAMLEKALGENLTADLKDNVFEEIAPDYTLAYNKRSSALLSKARAEQKEKAEAANRMDFLGRVDELENRKSQQLAGLRMDDDAGAGALADTQSTIDAHYDSAVARGILTPAEAQRAKARSRSDMTVGFYTRQASTMNADEIRKMRADMTTDYAAGKLEGVTADDWSAIEKGLVSAESARRTQDTKAAADLEKRGEDIAKRVARGLPVSADEIARFQLDAGTAPRGKEIVSSTLLRLKVSDAIRTMPIGEVDKNLKTILGEGATADDIDFARRTIAEHKKDLQSDPLGVAERFGVLPISAGLPLDGDIDVNSVSGAFSERINAANAAGQHFGVSPKYFRPGEAAQIEEIVKADPKRGLAIAAGLVDAAGRDAPRVLRELGEAAPAVALSGGLVAAGGSQQAALDLIAGFGKSPEGKAYTDMPNTKRIPIAQAVGGEALSFAPAEVNRLDEAAAAIARKRLYDAGIDPKKDDAKPIYERAYQEAAGATFSNGVQFGGFTKYQPDRWFGSTRTVLLPPSIRADKFGDLIGALDDNDVGKVVAKNGKTWTAGDFKKAAPVAVNGGYAFALGDPSSTTPQFIADANGNPVVLDLAGMSGRLGSRVPGAYR
ncbi:hypothetical protein ASF91_15045 [Rhizobium sp. Leaf155]|nr:hypothetical protein ASF91_15045 [Rhizobium sp. Leaf155]